MLSPDYLLHISEGAESIAEKLHNDIISRIVERMMLRIGRGEDYILTAQDKWQIENLQQAGYLLEDIQKDIADATRIQQSEIAEAMEDAGVKALAYDDKVYRDAGLSPVPLTQSPELIRLMQRNYEATLHEWNNFTRSTADKVQQLFLSELDHAYHLVSTGALSYSAAVKEVINTVVSDGVKVTYPTGHSDTIETATLRAVRTGISQATAQIQTTRMDEMDVDLVITSSHLGARPSHQVWQGKVFSRSGRSAKYPGFIESTGYGSVSGLCGANCRHSFSPYFEGMDNPFERFDSEENVKQYEKEQRQRVLERRIRDTKREVMGLKKSVDKCQDEQARFGLDMDYQRKSALLQKQNKAYSDYCADNNLRPLADRLEIAKWDRKQAAAARGATKRYENVHGGTTVRKVKSVKEDVIGFRKARTIEEIQERIVRASGGSKVDFGGMDIRVANAYLQGIEEFYAEYPELKGFIDAFDTRRTHIAAAGQFEVEWNMNSATFRPKAKVHISKQSYDEYLDAIKENIESGFKYDGSNGITTAKHELTHALQAKMYYIERGLYKDGEFTEQNIVSFKESKYSFISDSNKIVNKAVKKVYGNERYSDKIKYLGDYAKQDRDELIAQAISYEMSGKTHPFSAEIKRIFDEKYEKIFGVTPVKNHLDNMAESGTMVSGGRILNPESKEGKAFAKMYYPEIRSFSTDCKNIAKNLGKKEEEIESIKQYLFHNDSFEPDCAIAQSWQRLIIGDNIQKHDKTLIEHELCEMSIKKENPNISHSEAHILATKKYNYQKEVDEYYGNLKENKKNE